MSRRFRKAVPVIVLIAVLLLPASAQAYVGPGGVITAIGALLALLVAIVASVAGFVWYPLKRLLVWIRGVRGRAHERPPAAPEAGGG